MPRQARKSRPVLPGLSRSITCSSKSCARLLGHKGSHRQTLTAAKPLTAKAPATSGGVEVLSADRYTVQPVAPARRPKVRKSPKALPQCRVSRSGIRCDRLTGHKAHGLRHRFTGLVTILPEAESPRMVADTTNGHLRPARRPKAASIPKGATR